METNMSFFLLQDNSLKGAKQATKQQSLKDMKIKEDQLRDLAAEQIATIFEGENLFLICTEYQGWDANIRRLDILAIDKKQHIVVIEIKRDDTGAHAELQALRYAAMLSVCNLDNLITAGLDYREKKSASIQRQDYEDELCTFLGVDDTSLIALKEIPRIFLVSSDFSKDLTTLVLWLNDKFGRENEDSSGMDISCFKANIVEMENGNILYIDQIIPIPNSSDYQVKARVKLSNDIAAAVKKKKPFAWKTLEEKGLLKPGAVIENIKNIENIQAEDSIAIYQGGGKFEWKGQTYASLNQVTEYLWKAYSLPFGNVQTPKYWRRKGATQSLSDEAGT